MSDWHEVHFGKTSAKWPPLPAIDIDDVRRRKANGQTLTAEEAARHDDILRISREHSAALQRLADS